MQKLINSHEDLEQFKKSRAYSKLKSLIETTNKACVGIEVPPTTTNPEAQRLLGYFSELWTIALQIEPVRDGQRFGSVAFRVWHERSKPVFARYGPELGHYLSQAWGNAVRLDYGTGHELNFLAFVGGVCETFSAPDILKVWAEYYDLARKLIVRYNLEPAGSHGVWGLDDHFHLCYLFGSAEIKLDTEAPPPASVLDPDLVAKYAPTNLYFGGIAFIYSVKRGPFFEHSPLLHDASLAANWVKINRGMLRMYQDNVFDKFPVMQHFMFGKLYEFRGGY